MTLYALHPDPATGSLEESEVVDESKYGWQFLEQAVTLWRLLENIRADEIETIMGQASIAAGDGELCFHAPDLHELVRLLTGVEGAIVAAGIVDQHWRHPNASRS